MRGRAGLLLTGAALVGCSSAQDEAARIDQHYTDIATFDGMSGNDLRQLDGVAVGSDPGTSPECFDSCSATIDVDAIAATSGPTSLAVITSLLAGSARTDPPPSAEQGPHPISGSYVVRGRTMSIELARTEDGGYSISFD